VQGALELADGRLLSWSIDNTPWLWSADGAPLSVLRGHTGWVTGALELADRRLLSWSGDNTLRLWGADGTPLAVLQGHRHWVNGALELADGRLLSWSQDGTLRLWHVDAEPFIDFACARLIRDFTSGERAQFGLDDAPTCPKFAAAAN
jgi:WD40 repeat protein